MVRLSQLTSFFITILMVASAPLFAQQPSQRLILKDGSYQTVTRWEIQGDRVRYYSAERFTWEEMPNILVDWPATEKYNRESAAQPAQSAHESEQDNENNEPDTPLVAPGLRLPDGGGVFLLDAYQNHPELVELEQNGSELNRHTGRNILRAAINPLALSSKQTIELKGEHAKVQSHLAQPAIYINVDPGGDKDNSNPQTPAKKDSGKDSSIQRYGMIRLEKKSGIRVVGALSVAVYGKVSQKEQSVESTNTPIGNWIKVTPAADLGPGEYALVEFLDKHQINLYVWDFGVDPSAPENANAWSPRQAGPAPKVGPPVLEKRPK